MNNKHRRTLVAIFEEPARADIEWAAIEALFIALGADQREGRGARVRYLLHGASGYFHRPHPRKEAKRYQVRDAREFLTNAGVTP